MSNEKHVWIIDNGASNHMAIHLDIFSNTQLLKQPLTIVLPEGTLKIVHTVVTVVLNSHLTLSYVFNIPDFQHNLLSVARNVARLLDQHQLIANFQTSTFQDLTTNLVKAVGIRDGGLYKLLSDVHSTVTSNTHANNSVLTTDVPISSFNCNVSFL